MNDPCASRHGRISRRRHWLLRQKLKHEQKLNRKVLLEARKLQRALMPWDEMPQISSASAPWRCECCFAPLKINRYDDAPHDKCKKCDRLLCSDCCFASEEAPLWYCSTCVVEERLLPIWRPTTERSSDRVLSVSLRVLYSKA